MKAYSVVKWTIKKLKAFKDIKFKEHKFWGFSQGKFGWVEEKWKMIFFITEDNHAQTALIFPFSHAIFRMNNFSLSWFKSNLNFYHSSQDSIISKAYEIRFAHFIFIFDNVWKLIWTWWGSWPCIKQFHTTLIFHVLFYHNDIQLVDITWLMLW